MNIDSNFDETLSWDNLKTCPHCHNEIPEIAKHCPYCGKACDKEKGEKKKPKINIAIAAGAIAIIILLISISLNVGDKSEPPGDKDGRQSQEVAYSPEDNKEDSSEIPSWDNLEGSENDHGTDPGVEEAASGPPTVENQEDADGVEEDQAAEAEEPPTAVNQNDINDVEVGEEAETVEHPSADKQDDSNQREEEKRSPEVSKSSFETACMVVFEKELNDNDITNIKQTAPDNLPETPIQMAINYLYARHGYHFQTDTIRKYFISTDWYEDQGKTIEQCEAEMNKIEKHNLDKLVKLRKK